MIHHLDAAIPQPDYEKTRNGKRKRKCEVCLNQLRRPKQFKTCSRCEVTRVERRETRGL